MSEYKLFINQPLTFFACWYLLLYWLQNIQMVYVVLYAVVEKTEY